MGVELLLVVQSFKVGLDSQRHNSGRAVSQIVLENFGIHGGGCRCLGGGVDSSQLVAGSKGKAAGALRGGLAAIPVAHASKRDKEPLAPRMLAYVRACAAVSRRSNDAARGVRLCKDSTPRRPLARDSGCNAASTRRPRG